MLAESKPVVHSRTYNVWSSVFGYVCRCSIHRLRCEAIMEALNTNYQMYANVQIVKRTRNIIAR